MIMKRETVTVTLLCIIFSTAAAGQFEETAFNIGIETNFCENSGTNSNFYAEILYTDSKGEKFQLQFELFEDDEDVHDQFQNGNIGKFTTIINGTSIMGSNLQFVVLYMHDCSDKWLPARITLEHYNWEFEWLNDEPCNAENSYWVTCEAPVIVFDHRYEQVEHRKNMNSRNKEL
uniref:PLAT domain-containing protein n=2 Tax=Plectus sambesii TaxID=2011161 RepID=A0A914X9A3_9BILA